MKIDSKRLGGIIFIVIFGSVALSAIAGYWQTESSKQPAVFEAGEYEGMPNPEEIRGSYSFSDVSRAFDIPASDLLKAFGLPEDTDPTVFRNKDLEIIYGEIDLQGGEIGNESVRLFVSLYAGLPCEYGDETYLPDRAVEILKEKAHLTVSQLEFLNTHSVEIGSIHNEDFSLEKNSGDDKIELEITLKGSTTFEDVISLGIEPEAIEEIIGKALPDYDSRIRDFCVANGLEFSVVKAKLQEAIDVLE